MHQRLTALAIATSLFSAGCAAAPGQATLHTAPVAPTTSTVLTAPTAPSIQLLPGVATPSVTVTHGQAPLTLDSDPYTWHRIEIDVSYYTPIHGDLVDLRADVYFNAVQ